jgi:hypothetical protein
MSPVVQHPSEQLKEIIQDKKMNDQGAREVQEQVDGEEVLNLDNTSSVLSNDHNTINNKLEHECLKYGVRFLYAHLICQSTDDRGTGHNYFIPGLPRTKFLAH